MEGWQFRKCKKHLESQVTRVCLKEQCECLGVLCEKCISEHHKPIRACMIDRNAEPLSYFTINQNRTKEMDYFRSALSSLCDLWEKGNQILQQQMNKLESTFLFQLNLLCRTFAIESAEEIEQGLRFIQQDQDEQLTLRNVQTVKSLYKNREFLQNLDKIRINTEQISAKITASLEATFSDLTKNFKKLNEILDNSDIFSIKQQGLTQPISKMDERLLQKTQQLKIQLPLANKMNTLSIQKRSSDPISINGQNISDLAIIQARTIVIENNIYPAKIIEAFLSNSYQVETLIIESPALATEDNLSILLMCLKSLKNLVLDCKNEIQSCSRLLMQSNNTEDLAVLDRLEYLYDFRRDLEKGDIRNFFIRKQISKPLKRDDDVKTSNEWSTDRKALSAKATFQLVRKFKLKNMWLANVSRSEQANFFIGTYDLSFLKQLTIGSFSQDHTNICNELELKLKTFIKLKSLTLIKISFLMFQFSGIFSKMSKLEVLVLHDLKMQRDQKNSQIFLNSIPKYCPGLRKLLISGLQGMNIDFISQLTSLETLILTRSKKLTFESNCILNIRHLNLYAADWNFGNLLKFNKNGRLNYLNLGCAVKRLDEIYPFIHNLSALSSLCLDRIILGPEMPDILNKSKATLQNLSIAGCISDHKLKTVDALKACSRLQHMDISKCDIEQHLAKEFPASIRYLVVSRMDAVTRKQLEARSVTVIETE